jgi:hypothetical protein
MLFSQKNDFILIPGRTAWLIKFIFLDRCDSSIQPELISFLSGGWKVMVIG